MTIQISFLLPFAAFVAVILFIAREILEYQRRIHERARKLSAAQSLLAFEAERNYYSQKRLFEILDDIAQHISLKGKYEFSAQLSFEEHIQYQRIERSGETRERGMPILGVHTDELARWLPTVAEIDKPFYEAVIKIYEAIFELKHLRSSLMRYLLNEEVADQLFLKVLSTIPLSTRKKWNLHSSNSIFHAPGN